MRRIALLAIALLLLLNLVAAQPADPNAGPQGNAGNGNANQQQAGGNANQQQAGGNANQQQWIQNGSGLSDLQITQNGGQAMAITQSNGGG